MSKTTANTQIYWEVETSN